MALLDNVWYVDFGNGSSTGYYGVAQYSNKAWVAGNILRQLTTPAVGNERCFVVHVGGTSTGEPTWTVTRGAINAFTGAGSCIECTGVAALNGDLSNTPTWAQYRTNTASATQGQVIKSGDGTKILICRTPGTMSALGSEPTWAAYTTAGATTNDGSTPAVWVTLQTSPFTYAIWNSPHARLANSFVATWGQTGNNFFVSSAHAETQASIISLTPPSLITLVPNILCVANASATTPPGPTDVTTGATISTTGASAINWGGQFANYTGISFSAGSSTSTASINLVSVAISSLSFTECGFTLGNTSASSVISLEGGNETRLLCDRCNFTFGATTQSITSTLGNSIVTLKNCTLPFGGSVPVSLFKASIPAILKLYGCDLSGAGGTTTLFPAGSNGYALLQDCKLGASVAVSATPTNLVTLVDLIRSDSSGTNYQQQRYWYQGTLIPETIIVRTGGAQITGTGTAWNITTTANSSWVSPFETFLIGVQNSVTNSNVTLTIYGIWKTAALPNNDQIWLDGDYLGASSSPLGTLFNTTKANILASGSPVTADSTSAWGAGAAAYQTAHAYGAFTGVILAGNASPQQLWFMSSHSGTGTSGSDPTIFNSQADGAQVTDNSGANQIVWQAMTRFSMSFTMSSPQPAQAGQINVRVKAALASTTFYVDPQAVL